MRLDGAMVRWPVGPMAGIKGKTRKNNVIVVFTIYALAMATEINFNCTCVCVWLATGLLLARH